MSMRIYAMYIESPKGSDVQKQAEGCIRGDTASIYIIEKN